MTRAPPLLLLALLGAAPASAAELVVQPSFTLMGEYDTNARRQAIDEDLDVNKPVGDGLLRARAGLFLSTSAIGGQLNLNADLGLKRFATERGQSMSVAQVQGSFVRRLPWDLLISLNQFTRARGQLSGVRTFGLTRTDLGVAKALPFGVWLQASAIAVGFYSVDAVLFSSIQSGVRFDGAYFVTPFERIGVFGGIGARGYPLLSAITESGTSDRGRVDAPLTAGATFSSTRAVYLSVGYTLTRNWSNSFGDSFTRHRLNAIVGVQLPLEITLSGQAALQLTSYDNGLSVGQRLLLADDDERQNNLTVGVSRPFLWGMFTEARLAVYGNEFARERVSFLRTTAGIGIRWTL